MITKEKLELYYNKAGVIVRDSSSTDIAYLRNNLKQSDINEIWASHHKMPYEALIEGLEQSIECMTILIEGVPVGMFGIVPSGLPEDKQAVIWFLSTDDLFKIRYEFIKHSIGFIGFIFHLHPEIDRVFNWVDVRNKMSIRWLSKIGATMHEAKPFGAEQMPFHFFEFRRPGCVIQQAE